MINEVIAKVLDLLTDGKADAIVRRILGLAGFRRTRASALPCLNFLD